MKRRTTGAWELVGLLLAAVIVLHLLVGVVRPLLPVIVGVVVGAVALRLLVGARQRW